MGPTIGEKIRWGSEERDDTMPIRKGLFVIRNAIQIMARLISQSPTIIIAWVERKILKFRSRRAGRFMATIYIKPTTNQGTG